MKGDQKVKCKRQLRCLCNSCKHGERRDGVGYSVCVAYVSHIVQFIDIPGNAWCPITNCPDYETDDEEAMTNEG